MRWKRTTEREDEYWEVTRTRKSSGSGCESPRTEKVRGRGWKRTRTRKGKAADAEGRGRWRPADADGKGRGQERQQTGKEADGECPRTRMGNVEEMWEDAEEDIPWFFITRKMVQIVLMLCLIRPRRKKTRSKKYWGEVWSTTPQLKKKHFYR